MPGPRSPVAALALALAAAAGAVLVPASQPALAGPVDASTPGPPVALTGPTYRQVAAATVTTTASGPITAHGSVQAQLTGGDQWDTAACYLTLDPKAYVPNEAASGSRIGPIVEADLTSQVVAYDIDFDFPTTTYRAREAQLRQRQLSLVGFASPVPSGEHTVAMLCAVSQGTDAVTFEGATVLVLTEPAAGAIFDAATTSDAAATFGPVQSAGPAKATLTTTSEGPVVVLASATVMLTSPGLASEPYCQISPNYYGWADRVPSPHKPTVGLTTQEAGYLRDGELWNRPTRLRKASVGLAHVFWAPAGSLEFRVSCGLPNDPELDAVRFSQAGIVAFVPGGAVDDGYRVLADRIEGPTYRGVASTTLRTTGPSRLVAIGTTNPTLEGPNQWDTAVCNLRITGSAAGPTVRASLSSQREVHWAQRNSLSQTSPLSGHAASLTPVLSAVVPGTGTHTIGMFCAVPQGTDEVLLTATGIVAFAIPLPQPPPPPDAVCGPVPPASAPLASDPAPAVSRTGGTTVLRKELTGYGAYGADGKADVLYQGQAATWTFPLPAGVDTARVTGAKVRVALVADDHYSSTAGYALRVWTNGACRYSGSPGLPHGAPLGGPFGNWVVKEYPVTPGGTIYTVTIANAGGDWFAADWIELELAGG
jgi:hypothetical protein